MRGIASLNDILLWSTKMFPKARYATADRFCVKVWSHRPKFNEKNGRWYSDEVPFIVISDSQLKLNLAPQLGAGIFASDSSEIRYSRCIASAEVGADSWNGNAGKNCKITRRNKLIACFKDGSILKFDTMEEACNFFEIRRTDTLRRIIENGQVLPDGSTTIDYLLEP